MKKIVFAGYFFLSLSLNAQTLGGRSVFNFLNLPNTPQLTSLGGMNVSQPSNDIGLAFNNPALLKPAMHSQMNAVFNDFYAGVNAYHLTLGYHRQNLETNFSWGLNYLDYGTVTETDASGNIFGKFRAVDWVMQLSASRSYLDKWNYGATIKFIRSDYGTYSSNGVAADVGVLYEDSSRKISASVMVKNAGFQLKAYEGTARDDLPFDLQAGVTKRLADAPFSFSLTLHHLHRFDVTYNDTLFNNENGFENENDRKFSFDKLFRHLVFGTTVYVGTHLEVTAGYNFLRRKELNIGNGGNGLNGFSLGLAVIFEKLQIRYARANYQHNTAYNQFGLNLQLNKYFGLGKFGERIGW